MNALTENLIQRIQEDGPLSIAQYMEAALGHPEHGYYMTREPFGVDGDFTTAPEISQMFGELIGLWAAIVWQSMGAPTHFHLVELGPGRGTLMADALRASKNVPGFHESMALHLVETSSMLRERQKESLPDVSPQWHDSIEAVPDGPIIVIANEFFDALPVDQYLRVGQRWCTRMVDLNPDGDGLTFVILPPSDEDLTLPRSLIDVADGSFVELRPAAVDISHDIGKRIERFGGAGLFIDYGHIESAAGETLQAVKNHEFHNPLADPGEADLTAHVDFAALSESVLEAGADVYGPIEQGDFLNRLGMAARAEALLKDANDEHAEEIKTAYERLVGPDAMGSLFKVMAVGRRGAGPLPGFD